MAMLFLLFTFLKYFCCKQLNRLFFFNYSIFLLICFCLFRGQVGWYFLGPSQGISVGESKVTFILLLVGWLAAFCDNRTAEKSMSLF